MLLCGALWCRDRPPMYGNPIPPGTNRCRVKRPIRPVTGRARVFNSAGPPVTAGVASRRRERHPGARVDPYMDSCSTSGLEEMVNAIVKNVQRKRWARCGSRRQRLWVWANGADRKHLVDRCPHSS